MRRTELLAVWRAVEVECSGLMISHCSWRGRSLIAAAWCTLKMPIQLRMQLTNSERFTERSGTAIEFTFSRRKTKSACAYCLVYLNPNRKAPRDHLILWWPKLWSPTGTSLCIYFDVTIESTSWLHYWCFQLPLSGFFATPKSVSTCMGPYVFQFSYCWALFIHSMPIMALAPPCIAASGTIPCILAQVRGASMSQDVVANIECATPLVICSSSHIDW